MSVPPSRAQADFDRRLPQQRPVWTPALAQKQSLWATCSVCGALVMIGYGFVAQEMIEQRKREILKTIGWQVWPVVKCPNCKGST